jgi:hypothetical protein
MALFLVKNDSAFGKVFGKVFAVVKPALTG